MPQWANPNQRMVFGCVEIATMLFHKNKHQTWLMEYHLEVALENSKKLYLLFAGTSEN